MKNILSNINLMKELTDSLLHDDRGAKFVYNNSKYAKVLLEKGKEIINEIGKYLKSIRGHLKECHATEKIRDEHGWILLLCGLVKKYRIDTGREIFANDFDKWITWASELDPNKIVYLE